MAHTPNTPPQPSQTNHYLLVKSVEWHADTCSANEKTERNSLWHLLDQQIPVNHSHQVVLVNLDDLDLQVVLSHQICPEHTKKYTIWVLSETQLSALQWLSDHLTCGPTTPEGPGGPVLPWKPWRMKKKELCIEMELQSSLSEDCKRLDNQI